MKVLLELNDHINENGKLYTELKDIQDEIQLKKGIVDLHLTKELAVDLTIKKSDVITEQSNLLDTAYDMSKELDIKLNEYSFDGYSYAEISNITLDKISKLLQATKEEDILSVESTIAIHIA